MQFNEKLKEVRVSQGLTQISIANYLGISERSYQNYEYGKREPNIETLIRLSVFLDVSLDELLCRNDYVEFHAKNADEH